MRRPDRAIRTSLLVMVALVAGAFAAFAPSASAEAYSPSSYAARLLSLVNGARADHGLPALRSASGTTTVADNWTGHMAGSQVLAHNPDLRHQIETHGSPDWTIYGENVGHGSAHDPDGLFHAYMKSPEHRENILTASYRYVGVAVVLDGESAWNTFDFVDTYDTPAPSGQPEPPADEQRAAAPAGTQAGTVAGGRVTASHAVAAASPAAVTAAPSAGSTGQAGHHTQSGRSQGDRRHALAQHADERVAVHGVHAAATQRLRGGVVAQPVAAQLGAPSLTTVPAERSSRAVLVAVAVLALVAAARRWTLTVARV